MPDLVFHWNSAALTELLRGPTGGVARDLARRAARVESQAKQNTSARPGPVPQTGRLRASITYQLGVDGQGLLADIGTNVYYGAILELYTFPNGAHYPWLARSLSAAR